MKRDKLPEEPSDKDSNACQIVFRMPVTGDRVTRRFMKTDLVLSLYDFVDSLGPEKLQLENANNGYLIMQSMPKKVFTIKTVSLAEVGLHPRAML